MTTPRHISSRTQGFTLLEVLLAVIAFSIVLAAIHSVFSSGLRLRNRTAALVEETTPMEQTVAIIKGDLAGLVLPGGTLFGSLQTDISQNSGLQNNSSQSGSILARRSSSRLAGQSSPDFYTTTGVVDNTSPFAEVQRVSYFLTTPTNDATGMDLYRSVTRNLLPVLTEDPANQFLMGGVQEIYFYFYDGTEWRDTWDSTTPDQATGLTNNLPQAVKVQIQLASERQSRLQGAPVEIVVPLLVSASTNQTAQTSGGGL